MAGVIMNGEAGTSQNTRSCWQLAGENPTAPCPGAGISGTRHRMPLISSAVKTQFDSFCGHLETAHAARYGAQVGSFAFAKYTGPFQACVCSEGMAAASGEY